MNNLMISADVLDKISTKHKVSRSEVEQCFMNRNGRLLTDLRLRHLTVPSTLWFIASTNQGRRLKILYIQRGQLVELKSAYEPNEVEERIYSRHG